MPLNSLFVDLAARLRSAEFLLDAVHPDHPTAFTRQRKLPLPTRVARMLSGMRKSIQGELDGFFVQLNNQAQLVRKVSEQAFAQARSKVSLTAIPFCMRVEKSGNSGFTCVRDFLRSGLLEQVVTLRAADRRDVLDFECPSEPQTVRLVRHIAPNRQVRVLMTNLLDVVRFPACSLSELYH